MRSEPAAPGRTPKQKAAEEEYVTISVTGSNIPKRIKKSDVLEGKDLPKEGDAQMVDKEQFMKSLGPGKKDRAGELRLSRYGLMQSEVERLDPKALARSGFAATRWGQRVPPFNACDFRGNSESNCMAFG